MRAAAALRNYALLVFLLLLVGGVLAQPRPVGGESAGRTDRAADAPDRRG